MKRIQILFLFCLSLNSSFSQTLNQQNELRAQLELITGKYKAITGIGLIHLEKGDTLTLNNNFHFPMLSVYKFPLALAVMNQVDKGELSLEQQYHVTKADLRDETWSPLKEKFPEGNVDVTLAELVNYMVSQSDNIACDILFRLVNGTKAVNKYIHGIGIREIEIVATEHEMQSDWKKMYANWTKPMEMTRMLEGFYQKKYLSDSSNTFLMNRMIESSNDATRLKGQLPEGTVVAHKTGSSGMRGNRIDACNDAGIIFLPDGTHVALSVFVCKSEEGDENTRRLIAEISKAVFDFYSKTK